MTNVSEPRDWPLVVEKDVKIPMRDGAVLYADVLRPDCRAERVPAIASASRPEIAVCVGQTVVHPVKIKSITTVRPRTKSE